VISLRPALTWTWTIGAVLLLTSCSDPPAGSTDLQIMNACLSPHGISATVDNGRYRLSGEVNSMQVALDSGCREFLTDRMDEDFRAQFNEVDRAVADCLTRHGVPASHTPGKGIDLRDQSEPANAVLDRCFDEAYARFRS
jgi:hypothetical protein